MQHKRTPEALRRRQLSWVKKRLHLNSYRNIQELMRGPRIARKYRGRMWFWAVVERPTFVIAKGERKHFAAGEHVYDWEIARRLVRSGRAVNVWASLPPAQQARLDAELIRDGYLDVRKQWRRVRSRKGGTTWECQSV